MDWNWYFSSLAQSAAAIVGIFGAFIISKILSNDSVFRQKTILAKELIVGAEKVVDDANDIYFSWFIMRTNEEAFDDAKELLDKDIYDAEQIYDECPFSVYVPREEIVEQIRKMIEDRLSQVKKKEEELQRKLKAQPGLGIIESVHRPLPKMPNLDLLNELNKERDSIDRVIRDARHQIRLISNHLENILGNPESSSQISYTLVLIVLLFFSGVIYPLSFLPLPVDVHIELSLSAFFPVLFSLKGSLLAVVSIIFTAIIAMFFYMNLTMKHSQGIIDRLKPFVDISSYSEYFAVMELNEKENAEKRRATQYHSTIGNG